MQLVYELERKEQEERDQQKILITLEALRKRTKMTKTNKAQPSDETTAPATKPRFILEKCSEEDGQILEI